MVCVPPVTHSLPVMEQFDPLDDRWWTAGSSLNWWDSTSPVRPAWVPDRSQGVDYVRRNRRAVLAVLTQVHQYRTVDTAALAALDPDLPDRTDATLYRHMVAAGILEAGLPIPTGGKALGTPRSAPFVALRLPAHKRLETPLRRLGFTPVDIASLGPGPLRGARQYDRHNLICVSLALTARKAGWHTWGEAYGRFSLMTGDPLMGSGGPDLMLQGETGWCAVELTASAGQTLEEKFRRWDRVLAHPGCPPMDVLWLDASRDHTLLDPLKGLASARPRQHAGSAAVWRDTLTCDDGFHMEPGTPPPPPDWMRGNFDRLAALVGFPDASGWRIPPRINGRYR